MKTRKILVILTILSLNIFTLNSITNASNGSININYSNYDGNQTLQISGSIDAKLDELLSKKFEDSDYYSKFQLLKTLSDKVTALSKSYSKNKDLFSELQNYLSLKSDVVYQTSKLTSKTDAVVVKSTFKKAINTKGATLDDVISKVNSTGKVEVTNENTNFETLSKSDFEEKITSLINTIQVNKYESYKDMVINNMKPIKSSNEFNKLKNYLPSSVSFTDEFGNPINGSIEIQKGFFSNDYYFTNSDFNSKVNQILSKIGNISKDDLDNIKITGKDKLYDIFGDDNLIVNFLNKISVNKQISKDIDMDSKVELIKVDGVLYGYGFYTKSYTNELLKYGNKFNLNPQIVLLLNKNGEPNIYLNTYLRDYIYIGDDSKGEKQYIIFDIVLNKLSFGKSGISGITGENIINDTNSNINIVFDDGTTLNNKSYEFSLDDLKKVINKKITKINIDGENMNSGLLLDKGSIINLYK